MSDFICLTSYDPEDSPCDGNYRSVYINFKSIHLFIESDDRKYSTVCIGPDMEMLDVYETPEQIVIELNKINNSVVFGSDLTDERGWPKEVLCSTHRSKYGDLYGLGNNTKPIITGTVTDEQAKKAEQGSSSI